MYYQEHIGKPLFVDIYLRKGNGKAGTLLVVIILGYWLIFRIITAHVTAELRIQAEEALCRDSKFIILGIRYRVASVEYLYPFLEDH